MTSRQTVAANQRNKNYASNRAVSPTLLQSTIYNEEYTERVLTLTDLDVVEDTRLQGIINNNEGVYLVKASPSGEWEHYYYVVTTHDDVLHCWYCQSNGCKHTDCIMNTLNAQYRARCMAEEAQRQEEVLALKEAHPVVGFQMTKREAAIASLIKQHPDWFVSPRHLMEVA